jgi:hypothetical protein
METTATIYENNKRLYNAENDPKVAQDFDILQQRQAAFDLQDGPRIGDFVRFAEDGTLRRFTYSWTDCEGGIQTTHPKFSLGSFHINSMGHCDYSGAMDHQIPVDGLTLLDEQIDGRVWFFSGGWARAHSGVEAKIPCRVYEYKPGSTHDAARHCVLGTARYWD